MRAFPTKTTDDYGHEVYREGMSLRDYFAAKAMQAYLYKTITAYEHEGCVITKRPNENEISDSAYQVADAMMKARKVTND